MKNWKAEAIANLEANNAKAALAVCREALKTEDTSELTYVVGVLKVATKIGAKASSELAETTLRYLVETSC